MNTYILKTNSFDPYYNLALEELLMRRIEQDSVVLHLWQSDDAVIIGKNQNPWVETNPEFLEKNGVAFARRFSGGGTVFHDLGNLNFCICLDRKHYDICRQMNFILHAVRSFGIEAEFNGRNDLTSKGCKFSGSAFALKKNAALHHGTLLIDSDIKKLKSFLVPSKAKIEAKGISSVRSGVINLSVLSDKINVVSLSNALIKAFKAEYGGKSKGLNAKDIADETQIYSLVKKNKSLSWLYERTLPFVSEVSNKFDFGAFSLKMKIRQAKIEAAECLCEGLSSDKCGRLSSALIGTDYSSIEIADRLIGFSEKIDIVSNWIRHHGL